MNMSELLRNSRQTRSIYVLVAVGLIIVALLISSLIARNITLPIQKLRDSMKSVQKGNFDIEDIEVISDNEIGSLTRSFNVMTHRIRELMEQNVKEQEQKRKIELKALQSQINPHFLYNTLEAIRGDALCEGIDSIADTTEALSTFFRYTITDTGNLVSVEDELENVENYFKIQQYRFGDKLDMRVNFPDDYARILECKLPKLTLQPVVENAIFHGLEAKAEGGVITISLEMTEKKLLINIHDDGIGIDEEELIKINQRLEITSGPLTEEKRKRGGIALPNVSRRIKLLFGDEYGIHIYSIPNLGTEVRISVPIITNREQRNQ